MKTKTKNLMIFLLIIVFAFLVVFVPIKYKNHQKSKEIPVDVSYKKFEEYEEKLKTFAKENDFEFSSHGNCDYESCYKTISLTSFESIQIVFDFENCDAYKGTEISISSSKDNTNIFSIIDYELIDEVFKIVFDKSYKDRLKKISGELSNINRDGAGKTMYLDREKDITIEYFLNYFYKPNTGIRTNDYYSVLIIKQ